LFFFSVHAFPFESHPPSMAARCVACRDTTCPRPPLLCDNDAPAPNVSFFLYLFFLFFLIFTSAGPTSHSPLHVPAPQLLDIRTCPHSPFLPFSGSLALFHYPPPSMQPQWPHAFMSHSFFLHALHCICRPSTTPPSVTPWHQELW
jgi:hypothetical protein